MRKSIPLFLACATLVSFAFVKPIPKKTPQINIVIDAGHGGTDFGATSSSGTEKLIVEQITNKIKFLNKNENVVIHLTRNEDKYLSLSDRAAIINTIKPDLVLSLHVNQSANVAKSGMEFYVANESVVSEKSVLIANALRTKFMQNNTVPSSEVKKAPFFILKKSTAPAIVVELGYLSNLSDRAYLMNDKEQDKIAATIISFVSELK
ncbi:N-acetylmuramoyl-L-alanine amidase [Flavobacterium sp. KS-LB2]|jgi:N-acetylmuramoyl-L-alanine amidase|uniref:N-acetylmuramoyl-L-alanine amidase family protein n=1 Tax=Flavobacterium sp. KS-LB2 TaxID=3120525 RepID=UPI0030D0C183